MNRFFTFHTAVVSPYDDTKHKFLCFVQDRVTEEMCTPFGTDSVFMDRLSEQYQAFALHFDHSKLRQQATESQRFRVVGVVPNGLCPYEFAELKAYHVLDSVINEYVFQTPMFSIWHAHRLAYVMNSADPSVWDA